MTLSDQIGGPAGDILGLHRLMVPGALGSDRNEMRRNLLLRLAQTHTLREALERLRAQGYLGVTVMNESRLFEALGRHMGKTLPMPVPIVPNLQGFMRDAVEHGMIGAGLRRAWRVGPLALAGVGLRGVTRVKALARRDFPAMLRSFLDLELADFARYDPPAVFLQAQVTDLALAMRNPRVLEAFFAAVQGRTGAVAGLATQNFGVLMSALKGWGLEAGAIITPWSATGDNMRPDKDACLMAAKASRLPIWADLGGRSDPPPAADRAVMKQAGLVGAVRDDLALWLNT